jgi:hypothetical protein
MVPVLEPVVAQLSKMVFERLVDNDINTYSCDVMPQGILIDEVSVCLSHFFFNVLSEVSIKGI